MTIQWNDAGLLQWRDTAEDFSRKRLRADIRGEEKHAAPQFAHILAELATAGFTSFCAAESCGGLAQDGGALAAVLEPISAVDATVGAAIFANAAAHLALRQVAPAVPLPENTGAGWLSWPAFHDLAEQSWPELSPNDRLSGALAMLLPGAYADYALTPARRGEERVLVMVNLHAAGVRRSAPVRTLGLSAAGIIDVDFDAAAVIHRCALTADSFEAIQRKLASPAMAMLCGLMRASMVTTMSYATERYQGGGPIFGWGVVRSILGGMQQRLLVAQSLLQQHANGNHDDARFALLHVATLASELTSDGIQLLGGNGYMKAYGQEKRMRDALQLQSLGGSVLWRRQQLATRLVSV